MRRVAMAGIGPMLRTKTITQARQYVLAFIVPLVS